MEYRVETETIEGQLIAIPSPSLRSARQKARALSHEHITAYAVAVDHGEAVGHVAYGDGRQTEIAGRIV